MAGDEVRTLGHSYIGTEHLLLGLFREEEGLGARILGCLGLTVDQVRQQVVAIVGGKVVDEADTPSTQLSGPDRWAEHLPPLTLRAQKVLELALREALSLGHNYIGTEHILLGLVRETEGAAARVLLDFDVGAEKVRSEVFRILSGPKRPLRPRDSEPEPLTEARIRAAYPDLGSIRIRVKEAALYGTLVAYDWFEQRCTIKCEIPGVDGQFNIQRSDLIVDDRADL